nr:hypothetical protein [Micromonospora sp. CB01531]
MTNAHEKLGQDGTVKDETTETLLRTLLDALATKIRVTDLAATAA